jgi:predicted nucleic acid-binding protein
MTSDFPAIIDACVLVQAAVRDTLLRLSEKRLFLAKWSDEIIAETERTLQAKLKLTQEDTKYLIGELEANLPDSWVEPGYKLLTDSMLNQEKDRHVVAAAVKSGAEVIITYNLKHFPQEHLKPFDVTAKHPDEFLIDLYELNPEQVVHTLHEQGASLKRPRTLQEVLGGLEA